MDRRKTSFSDDLVVCMLNREGLARDAIEYLADEAVTSASAES
jgi:hypothetical protein